MNDLFLKPDAEPRPQQYTASFAELGVTAQFGRSIDVRAPTPLKGTWSHVYLTPRAARQLLEWLPLALAEQAGTDPITLAGARGEAS